MDKHAWERRVDSPNGDLYTDNDIQDGNPGGLTGSSPPNVPSIKTADDLFRGFFFLRMTTGRNDPQTEKRFGMTNMTPKVIFKGTPTAFIIALMMLDQDCYQRHGIRIFSGSHVPILTDSLTLCFGLPGLELGTLHVRALSSERSLLEICAPAEVQPAVDSWWRFIIVMLTRQGLIEGYQEIEELQ